MWKYRWLIVAVFAVVLGMLAAPAPAVAQGECGFCEDFWDSEESEWYHHFGDGAIFQCDGGGSVGCHMDDYWENCSDFHDEGRECFETEPEAVAAAIAAGDPAAVAVLIAGQSDNFRVNVEELAVDVFSCDGAFMGRFDLTSDFVARVQSFLDIVE